MCIDNVYKNNKEIIDNTCIDFLTDEYIINTSLSINLDKQVANLLVNLKNIIISDTNSKRLFKLYLSPILDKELHNIGIPCSPINNKYLFYLLVVIAKLEDLKSFYNENNIPENIYYDTLSDISTWVNNHKNKTGDIGISQFNWLYNHISGKLFKIGRLQYMKIPFKGDVMLFRQVSTGYPLLLSYGDIKYDFLGNKTENNEDFTSTFIESDITITANPIREGKCQRDPITINKCDYTLEIKKDTPLLDMHIQEGENLDISKCIDSMKEAIRFYYKYFNGEVIKGFTCTSWLLNSNFKEILPENSNIRKFSSMFYNYPIAFNDDQIYLRVFNGKKDINVLRSIENQSSLQKSIIEGLDQGFTFEDASIIFPSYDMRKLESFRR